MAGSLARVRKFGIAVTTALQQPQAILHIHADCDTVHVHVGHTSLRLTMAAFLSLCATLLEAARTATGGAVHAVTRRAAARALPTDGKRHRRFFNFASASSRLAPSKYTLTNRP